MKKSKMGYVYILPWLLGFTFLTAYPFLRALVTSFTDYNLISKAHYVGFANYIALFKDAVFTHSLWTTFKYTIITVPLQLAFSLMVAFVLNFNLKGIRFYRTAYYIPSILGGNIAVSVLWRFIFQQNGVVNQILGKIGIEPVGWFSKPFGAMTVIILLKIWQFGSSMLIFLAALKNVSQDLYEAADIDGASKFRQFFTITIPLITPTVFFNLVMQMNNAFQEFNGPYLVTGRGPLDSTYMTSMYIYDNAFKFFKMGYASAASWVLFLIIVIITVIMFATQDKWVFYSDEG